MVLWTLLVAAGAALVVGLTYGYVGERLRRRDLPHPEHQRAVHYFALWWYALAVIIVVGASLYVFAAFGATDFTVQLGYLLFQRVGLAVALVGLMYYLIYLITGTGRLVPLLVFYGAYAAFLVYSVMVQDPDAVQVYDWRTDLHYTTNTPQIFRLVNFVMLLLPPVVGSLIVFRLGFKLNPDTERLQRFRTFVISWAIIVWWVVSAFAGQEPTLDVAWIQLLNRAVGVATALTVLTVYTMPGWLVRWIGRDDPSSPSVAAPLEGRS